MLHLASFGPVVSFFFFFFLLLFLILTNVFKFLNTNYATGRAAMTKNGPNDARRVVWTLCEYFFFFFFVFLILTRVFLVSNIKLRYGKRGYDENGDASFGPCDFFFFLLLRFFDTK